MTEITGERAFLVLNGAHLKKMANAEEIAAAVGVDVQTAASVLASAVAKDRAMDIDGRFLLTPEGTAVVHEYYRDIYDPLRLNTNMITWYERFEAINEQFIKQVSEWQTTE